MSAIEETMPVEQMANTIAMVAVFSGLSDGQRASVVERVAHDLRWPEAYTNAVHEHMGCEVLR